MCGVSSAVRFMICRASHGVTVKKWIQDCAPQRKKNGHGVRVCDFFGTNARSPIKFPHLLISARNDTWRDQFSC